MKQKRNYAAIIALLMPVSVTAQPKSVRSVMVETSGSSPPMAHTYECARQLEGQLLIEARYESCLERILSSGFFESGKVKIQGVNSHSVDLRFVLRSKNLILRRLEFAPSLLDREVLAKWLDRDSENLRVGLTYTRDRERATFNDLGQYFVSQGRTVLWTSQLSLDYDTKTAEITYTFVEGPRGPAESSLPPNSSDCSSRIALLDLTRLDDKVPIPLVNKMSKVKAFGCFDSDTLKEDESHFRSSGFLRDIHYIASKDGVDWKVRMEGSAEPLVVASLVLKGYGQEVNLSANQLDHLPLRVGMSYSSSLANDTLREVESLVRISGKKTAVVQDVELIDSKSVVFIVGVLSTPEDVLYINGKKL